MKKDPKKIDDALVKFINDSQFDTFTVQKMFET